jgi:hypothetical protein
MATSLSVGAAAGASCITALAPDAADFTLAEPFVERRAALGAGRERSFADEGE